MSWGDRQRGPMFGVYALVVVVMMTTHKQHSVVARRPYRDPIQDSSKPLSRLSMAKLQEPFATVGLNTKPPHGGDLNGGVSQPERYSGYFKLKRTYDAHMFFFLFEARKDADKAPVVLWMTGGPGCSSELAVFYENGPWKLNDDLSVEETQYGWDTVATMIYVDQPINTGFSWSDSDDDRCYDEECVSSDMLDFLEALFEARPELKTRDFYITGESYAGHYVPAVASKVFRASKKMSTPIKLKGFAIGNGLTDPAIQYGAYPEFAYQHGLLAKSSRDRMMAFFPACQMALQVCDGYSIGVECVLAVQFCQAVMFTPIMVENPNVNIYDYRKSCDGPMCYDFSVLEEYLNQPDVRDKLGVGKREWQECNMDVYQDMMSDWGHSFDKVIPEMLEAGVRGMIYAGDKDIICNELGNRQWVDALEWKGAKEWKQAANKTWHVDGEEAGLVTEAQSLSFVSVKDAGHMVPMDQPKHALHMIKTFIEGKSLSPDTSSDMLSRVEQFMYNVRQRFGLLMPTF